MFILYVTHAYDVFECVIGNMFKPDLNLRFSNIFPK